MNRQNFWQRTWPYLAAIGSLLAIWQIAALLINKSIILPGVFSTLPRLIETFQEKQFIDGITSSLYRLAVGYPVACLLGALLGLLAGISRTFAVYLRSLISILQSIPPITWVPFLVILLGFGDKPIIAVITLASFFRWHFL